MDCQRWQSADVTNLCYFCELERKQKSRKSKKKNTEVPYPSSSTDNVPDENVPTNSNDPLLSGKDRLKLTELMDLCTNLQKKILDLEKAKTAQDSEIASLKKRVKKLKRRNKSRMPGLKDEQEVEVEKVVSTAEVTTEGATTTTVDELTLAQTLIEIKAAKPKDKGKAKMIKFEKPLKKKDQIIYDQEVTLNLQAQLQAELEEEERFARQKEEEASIALIESWDNTQAMMDVDYQMAQQLQAEEQEQLSIEENLKLFVRLLEARKKHFAEIRAREKRNKPPTQAQQRKLYCNYLKNMEELEQEVAKKQKINDAKVDDDQEEARMKELMNIVPDEEKVAIDVIPLATKPPCIRRFGNSVETEIPVWRTLQDEKVLIWKLFDSCGVHFLRLQSMHIFMLVEKKYPLTPATITGMLNKKL
ncbi:hypothetical protein Tco_0195288 [Tanacetum coccineum]